MTPKSESILERIIRKSKRHSVLLDAQKDARHLLAENSETEYIAYVSEQNLLEDRSGEPVRHPQIGEMFDKLPDGRYEPKRHSKH